MLRTAFLAAFLLGAHLLPAPLMAQTAAKPEPSAQALAMARELVDVSGMSKSLTALLPSYLADAKSSLARLRPEVEKDLNEVISKVQNDMASDVEALSRQSARTFATRFTEAEVKELVAFFKTPTGKKYVEEQPALLDDFFSDMKDWSTQASQRAMQLIREEMKKRGHDI
jgi:uncharacterized protein